jgi:hypothetical protein
MSTWWFVVASVAVVVAWFAHRSPSATRIDADWTDLLAAAQYPPRRALPADVADTMRDIQDVSFIVVEPGRGVTWFEEATSVAYERQHPDQIMRWNGTILFLNAYSRAHPAWHGEFFVSTYDGFREHTEPVAPTQRRYVPWLDLSRADRQHFVGPIAGFTRFRHRHPDPTLYPALPRPVLAFNRHQDDHTVLLLPDPAFITTGFDYFVKQVGLNDIAWTHKIERMMWRGSRHTTAQYRYVATPPAHPREAVVALCAVPTLVDACDVSFQVTPIAMQLRFKYLLDIDGEVNAWSALFWKLLSGSVVFKTKTHWEQW